MSLRSRLSSAWRALTRAGPAGYGGGGWSSGGPMTADAFGAKRGPSPWQLVESYKQIAFACTEFNAFGVSQLPLRLYAASGNGKAGPRSLSGPKRVERSEVRRLLKLPYVRRDFGGAKEVEDVHEITEGHPLLATLERPAVDSQTELSYFDQPSWVATLVRYIDMTGIAYVLPESQEGTGLRDLVAARIPPELLWPLQSQHVRPVPRVGSALIEKFRYFAKEYDPGDLMYIRLRPSLRDPYGQGYSAAAAAWQYSGLEDKGISMWDLLLGEGAKPSVVASPSDANAVPGDDERERFRSEVNTFHARGRSGRWLFTNGAWQFTTIAYPGFDLAEMEVNIYNMERMCNCWGVPVAYMSRESNLANLQASDRFHAKYGIEPRAQCIASALTDLVRKYDPRLFFAFDGAIGEDEEKRAKIIDMQVRNGQITWNQANADSPWPPRDDGKEVWIPQTLVQPSMAREKHEQGLASAQAADKAKAAGGGPKPGGPPAKSNSEQERSLLTRADRVLRRIERELRS